MHYSAEKCSAEQIGAVKSSALHGGALHCAVYCNSVYCRSEQVSMMQGSQVRCSSGCSVFTLHDRPYCICSLHMHMGRFCLTQKWSDPGLFNSNFGRSLRLSGLVNRVQINSYLTVSTALVALVNL